jgi:hypothetical protein
MSVPVIVQRTERGDISRDEPAWPGWPVRWYAEDEHDTFGPFDTREEALDVLYPEDAE